MASAPGATTDAATQIQNIRRRGDATGGVDSFAGCGIDYTSNTRTIQTFCVRSVIVHVARASIWHYDGINLEICNKYATV